MRTAGFYFEAAAALSNIQPVFAKCLTADVLAGWRWMYLTAVADKKSTPGNSGTHLYYTLIKVYLH